MPWEQEEVFHEGDLYFARLFDAIDGALASVNFETYIFEYDALGKMLMLHLAAAAKRGVRVRVLVDGVGSSHWSRARIEALARAKIEARIYHPLPWARARHPSVFRFFRLLSFRRIGRTLTQLNRRNHRKVCVIDERIAFVGGINVSASQSARLSGAAAWRDTSARVTGDGVGALGRAFEAAWSGPQRRKNPVAESSEKLVRLNNRLLSRRNHNRDLVRRIARASKRVWITTPYFSPGLSFLVALRYAALKGADVRLLLPSKVDVPGIKWANRAFYSALLAGGVRIHEYLPRMLHAKIVQIDDWCTVGSSNQNSRSLIHDLEVDAVLSLPATLAAMEEQFRRDLADATEITSGRWSQRPWINRVLERLTRFFRYWL